MHRRDVMPVVLALAAMTVPLSALAQSYPSKPIRLLVSDSAGGLADTIARIIGNGLGEVIGQRVVIENRAGAASNIGALAAARSAPDGYTIYQMPQTLSVNATLYTNLQYDVFRDFLPIMRTGSSPALVVVHPSLPVKTTKELITLARAKPGALNYSAGGGGSSQHIAAELFNYLARVKTVRVFYKGAGPSIMGLLTGEVQLMFAALGPIMPHVKTGKVRALAVTSPKHSPLARDLPPIADVLPGYANESAIGLFAPKKTPSSIIKLLNTHTQQALKALDPNLVAGNGVEVVASSPEEFARFIKADMSKMAEVIKSGSFAN